MTPPPCTMPIPRRKSSTLVPLDHSPAVLKNDCPANALPPERGTRFITGPPVSDSPSPPETITDVSAALFVSYVSVPTPPPPDAAPTVIPLICTLPSLLG